MGSIPLDTQVWNRVIMMMLMTLRWRRMRYMVSYHNTKLWGTLLTTGGHQDVHKVNTNKFVSLTMCVMIFAREPQNHVSTINNQLCTSHRKAFRLKQQSKVSWWQFYFIMSNYSFMHKLLVQVLLLEVLCVLYCFETLVGIHYLYHNNKGLPTQYAIFMLSCHTLGTSTYLQTVWCTWLVHFSNLIEP